jgi:integrase/recombinase XerD
MGKARFPHQAKTGSGPILLTCSFHYVRDWLNQHPFKGEPNARLICNLHNGAPIKPEALHTMMAQLKKRITRLIENGEIKGEEQEKMLNIISNKRFNPYCIRHSAITSDSDYLPEYALKKKVRWSMNSRQGSRYIKTRMGNELKNKILAYNGITSENEIIMKPTIFTCPRCEFVNVIENKYCFKCSYPLKPEAYEKLKDTENQKFNQLQQKHEQDVSDLKGEMNNKFA